MFSLEAVALSADLVQHNPWWKSKKQIEFDPKIKEWNESVIKWDPRIRHTFRYGTDVVYSLRGPRQVGKTTLIKLQIRDFLTKGVSPWNIMYYAFDVDNSPKDLINVVTNYLDNTKRQRKDGRCYIFLDEISSIKEWQKGIKKLWDLGKLQNCSIVVTGSHSIDLRAATERLPGRRGITDDTYDKIIPPMKFSEYVSSIDADIGKLITTHLQSNSSRQRVFGKLLKYEIDKRIDELQPYLPELNRYLEDYMITGGIPKVIDEYLKKRVIPKSVYTTYLNVILGDLSNLDRNEAFFSQLATNVIKCVGWPTSWRSLQKDTDIGSPSTVINYVSTLEDMFVLSVFYQYDSQKKRALFEKDKKIYFHDPFFLHSINGWLNNRDPFELAESFIKDPANQGALVEGIVGDHLIRLAFAMSQNKQVFNYSNAIFYWKYEKQQEVDFILNSAPKMEVPIEVKFKNSITNRDLDGLINFKKLTGVNSALLVTKDQLEVANECVKIPAAMFLLLV